HPTALTRLHADAGAVGIAPEGRVDQPHQQPVAALGGDVAVQSGGSADGGHKQIQSAVAIDVRASQAARDAGGAAERRIAAGDVPKMAGAVVDEELVALSIAAPERPEGWIRVFLWRGLYATVDDGQVEGTIVVKVAEDRPKAGARPLGSGQAGGAGLVL